MYAKLLADQGKGTPVLYVPGIDGTGELLLGCAPRLEAEFRLLRFHYHAGPEADSYAGLAASIAGIARELKLERCLVLCESFGGAVGLQLALDFPELVGGVMVVNSFAHYSQPGRLWLSRMLAPMTPKAFFRVGRHLMAPFSLFGRRLEREALALFRAQGGTYFDEAFLRRLELLATLDLRPRLPELQQPVALYAGDRDRVVESLDCLGEMQESLPDATLEVISGGGHLILPLAGEPWPERMHELARRAGLEGA